ncbi:hypothetical protein quinque_011158 [Culex quinquefasciatus]
MMTSDWDKIKRLASDFQNAQLTTSFQRLSELRRSGHEKGLLEVIYTIDGHLRDEMFVRGGRINLVDLANVQ